MDGRTCPWKNLIRVIKLINKLPAYKTYPATKADKYFDEMLDAWVEAGQGSGYTYAANDAVKRIDFIWHSPDLGTVEIKVIQTQASDHMPVLVTVE